MKYILLPCLLYTFTATAQMPEEIQWKHLEKVYNADSSSLTLRLNNQPLNGSYKIPFDEGGYSLIPVKAGKINGDVYWYTTSGRKEARLQYKNGVRNGLKENYDQDGKVWLSQYYKDGKQDGDEIMYSGGVIHHTCSYKKGLKEGVDITYTDGIKMTEDHYTRGMKNSVSRIYDREGSLQVESHYKDDRRDGFHDTYANGRKNMSVAYRNGIRHGVSYMYKQDGSVLFESYFYKNNKVSKEEFERLEREGGE